MWFYVSQGLILGGWAAMQPGPFQAYLLGQTLRHGWRGALPATLAPLLSDGPVVTLVLLVLTQVPDWLLRGLQGIGGLFLLYLSWTAARTANQIPSMDAAADSGGVRLWQAALLNALSPVPYIFWATIAGPILLRGWAQAPGWGIGFAVSFYGALIGGFAGYVLLFAWLGGLNTRLNRWLVQGSAVFLLLFGLYQIWLSLFA